MSEEVWYRVVQIVINRQEVQGYAAKTCYEVRSTCTLYILYIDIHVLMRDERRKKERSKQRQTNKQGKAT